MQGGRGCREGEVQGGRGETSGAGAHVSESAAPSSLTPRFDPHAPPSPSPRAALPLVHPQHQALSEQPASLTRPHADEWKTPVKRDAQKCLLRSSEGRGELSSP